MDFTLVEQLQKCYSFLSKLEEKSRGMSELSLKKSDLDFERSNLEKQLSINNLKKDRNSYIKATLAILYIPIFIIFKNIADIVYQNSHIDLYVLVMLIFIIAFVVDLLISVVIGSFLASKKSRKCSDRIAVLASMISTIREKQNILENEVYSLLESKEAELVEELIPPDYREAFAVEKFIYFFRNGHVDTMKEAVREYDTYIHNITMEAAAEESSRAAAETALQAAKTAKNAEEIQFWTMLNTFINASRK